MSATWFFPLSAEADYHSQVVPGVLTGVWRQDMQGWRRQSASWSGRALAAALALVALAAAAQVAGPKCELCASKSFAPDLVASGGTSTLTIALSTTDKFNPIFVGTFTDSFPPNMTLVSVESFQCGGTVTATGNGFTVANAKVPRGGRCVITAIVRVDSPVDAVLTNTIPVIKYDFDDGGFGRIGPISGVITVAPPPLEIITPQSVFAAPVNAGTPVDVTLQAQGGAPPYTWQLAGGGLPPGMTLGSDGRVAGTPTVAGIYVFTVGVTDSVGKKTTQDYVIVVAKGVARLTVTTAPSPVISGQTMTVTAKLAGPVVATGTVDVWVAGSATRCPAPFKFGVPANPVAAVKSAPLDVTGTARVAIADLTIDDYGVCVRYSGDTLYSEAFAGPLDAFVIKGVLLPAPAVALSVPARAKANSSVAVGVAVTPVDATPMPGGSVEIRRDGQTVATVDLVDGLAHTTVAGPVAGNVMLSAVYMGDGMFPPAASPPYVILLDGGTDLTIPTLSQSLLALLAILLGFLAARRLRR